MATITSPIQAVIFDFWGVIFNPATQQINPGLRDYLELLQAKTISRGIASSSSQTMISHFLEQNNLRNYFSVIIGQEAVTQMKPDPECYLLAAKQLHCLPVDCVVIDDTAACVTAAQQAGFQTILYGQNGENFDSISKHLTQPSLREGIPLLSRRG